MSHWQPARFRYKIVLMTSRMFTARRRPPCLAAGTSNSKTAHCSSVRSVEYAFRGWVCMGVLLIHGKTPTMQHHKALGQDYFPDSLSEFRHDYADGGKSLAASLEGLLSLSV